MWKNEPPIQKATKPALHFERGAEEELAALPQAAGDTPPLSADVMQRLNYLPAAALRETGESVRDREESPPRKRKRVDVKLGGRKRHHLSDGESDNEDEQILYRALRKDELNPFQNGLNPPEGYDPSVSASAHITSGSKAKAKSRFISATRSIKVAAAWSVKSGGEGRVVKFRKPDTTTTYATTYDMTNEKQAALVFPKLKGTSYNLAKASQEVLIDTHVPRNCILDVFISKKVRATDYLNAKTDESTRKIRSRTVTESNPVPVILSSSLNRES
jgi:hypothetical protein